MNADLTDLRLLRLAAFYERAYERFIIDVARPMAQGREIIDGLDTLVSREDDHGEAIAALSRSLAADLGPEDHRGLLRAALLDVVDIERSARDFYLARLDEARDERVVRLFQRLAYEEERHRRVAERLLAHVERDDPGRDHDPAAEGLQFLHDLEAIVGPGPIGRREVRV